MDAHLDSFALLGMVTCPVQVSAIRPGEFSATSPHWPGVAALGPSPDAAKNALQYELERRIADGERPVLQLSA